jgi:hypothetical protein
MLTLSQVYPYPKADPRSLVSLWRTYCVFGIYDDPNLLYVVVNFQYIYSINIHSKMVPIKMFLAY